MGLGNYTHKFTRHSVGLLAVDYIARQLTENPTFSLNKTIGGWTKTLDIDPLTIDTCLDIKKEWLQRNIVPSTIPPHAKLGDPDFNDNLLTPLVQRTLTILKPKAFMNLSGGPVKKAAEYPTSIPKYHIITIHDDLQRQLGKHAYKFGGSSG